MNKKGKAVDSRFDFGPRKNKRYFWKSILDSRIGFFLGMESGGDVKCLAPSDLNSHYW